MTRPSPRDLVLRRRILMFAGSGGVGKTTVAAATALWAAMAGRKVLVVTIDPARRLANALGLTGIDIHEARVPLEELSPVPVTGRLHAMMMDTKRVMDELIVAFAPSKEVAERVVSQRIYQTMSDSMVGAQEVVALGKLYELYFKRDYDLIVVDTAPTKHAIDFFETPQRLIHLFDMEVFGWLSKPVESVSSFGFGLVKRSANLVADIVEKAFGISVLSDIGSFFASIQDLAGGFKERSERILAVLQNPEVSTFHIVTSPQRLAIEEALYIAQKLHKLQLELGFTVVNRVNVTPGLHGTDELADPTQRETLRKQLQELGLELDLLQRLAQLTGAMAQHDRDNIKMLQSRLPQPQQEVPLLWVPFFSSEICDLDSLVLLGRELYGAW